MYDDADMVLVMESGHRDAIERTVGDASKVRLLLDFTDAPGDIPDPCGGGRGAYEAAYVAIERGCRALVKELAGTLGA